MRLFDYTFIATKDNTILPSQNQTLHEKEIPGLHSRWKRCGPSRNAKHLISLNKSDYSYQNGQFAMMSSRAMVELDILLANTTLKGNEPYTDRKPARSQGEIGSARSFADR
jgi:hypothetical protein